jgi:uncharacterized protein with HEPN domain
MLGYIRERIERIDKAMIEDPRALSDEGRLAGEAILWNLMALADATTRLSDELKKRHPEINWDQVRGFRNVATHAYDQIQLRQIANIVAKDLPKGSTPRQQPPPGIFAVFGSGILTPEVTPQTSSSLGPIGLVHLLDGCRSLPCGKEKK